MEFYRQILREYLPEELLLLILNQKLATIRTSFTKAMIG